MTPRRKFGLETSKTSIFSEVSRVRGQKKTLARFRLFFSLSRVLEKKKKSFGLDHGRAFFKKWLHKVVLGGSLGPESVFPGAAGSPGSGPGELRGSGRWLSEHFFENFRVFNGFWGPHRVWLGGGKSGVWGGQIWGLAGVWLFWLDLAVLRL